MTHSDDEQLARAARSGDRSALGALLEKHQGAVFAMTYRILHDRADALDAAQETYLKVCRHIGRYRPGRPFAPWIRTIAVRAALDHVRRHGSRPPSDHPVEALPAAGPDPHQGAVGSETATRIGDALAGLTPAQRAAFVCKEIEGLDTKETARAMGCRRATVRWHLFEARKKLASLLGGAT